jgi:hypothetical protein
MFPEFRCHRIIGWLAGALALLLLQGCSSIRLVYNNSPDLSYWGLDSYVDLDDSQATRVRAALPQLLAWHRSHELPLTADLLNKLQSLVAAPTTPALACSAYKQIHAHLQPLIGQAAPLANEIAGTLSAAQLQHIEQRLRKNNQDYQAKWGQGSPQELSERRFKAGVERYENLYGTLEDAQRAALRDSIATSFYDFDHSFAERLRRQKDLLQTLKLVSNGPGPANLSTVQALIQRLVEPVSQDAYNERLKQENCATFAVVHNAATPGQRERAVRRLAAYERDARELAVQR